MWNERDPDSPGGPVDQRRERVAVGFVDQGRHVAADDLVLSIRFDPAQAERFIIWTQPSRPRSFTHSGSRWTIVQKSRSCTRASKEGEGVAIP